MGEIVGAVFRRETSRIERKLQGDLLTNYQGLVDVFTGIRRPTVLLLSRVPADAAAIDFDTQKLLTAPMGAGKRPVEVLLKSC
jgi:hypothetical protein